MNNYEQRQQAIDRYQAGESVTSIVASLGKSRRWFYHWLDRFQAAGGQGEWFVDHSRAPKRCPHKTPDELEQQVIGARKQLERQRMAQTGAIAISYQLHQQGITPPPVWTINRILARHGLSKNGSVHKSAKAYPELFIHTHQMDLVGPRWIKGDGCFYSLNLIDTCCHSCSVNPLRSKTSVGIAQAVANFWATHGMPDALQMDNELAFRGSNRYPRSFGLLVRFALAVGVAPVFIPTGEPWRNGIIEKFNDTYDKRLLRPHRFQDFEHLQRASAEFTGFHNGHHRYSGQQHKTPNQMRQLLGSASRYDHRINLHEKIPLSEGSIYFVRFIRSDGKLHLPTESFTVSEALKYSYVVAEISIDHQWLFVHCGEQIVEGFEYLTPVDW